MLQAHQTSASSKGKWPVKKVLKNRINQEQWVIMVAYQSCVNMNDTLRAKRNVFQVTGSPMVIWLIVSSIGQVALECQPSVGEVSVTWKAISHLLVDSRSLLDRYAIETRSTVDWQLTECRSSIDRVATATSTDIAVNITDSKHDPRKIRALSLWENSPSLFSVLSFQLPTPSNKDTQKMFRKKNDYVHLQGITHASQTRI